MTDKKDDGDNVVFLGERYSVSLTTVPDLCAVASETLHDLIIIGEADDGSIKMMTSQSDIGTILFYLEAAKTALMQGGLDEE